MITEQQLTEGLHGAKQILQRQAEELATILVQEQWAKAEYLLADINRNIAIVLVSGNFLNCNTK